MKSVMKPCGIQIIVFSLLAFMAAIAIYGSEWSSLPSGGGEKGLRAIVIDPLNPQNILIGSEKGVLKSADGGKVWTNVLDLSGAKKAIGPDVGLTKKSLLAIELLPGETDTIAGATALVVDPADSQKVCAGSAGGIYASTDGGRNWKKAGGALADLPLFVFSMAIDLSNPDLIYAGTLDKGLVKSFDGGATWDRVAGWQRLEGEPGRESVTSVAVHPLDSNIIFAGTADAVFKTKDGGGTWEKVKPDVKIAGSLAIDQVYPDIVYLGTSSGLYRSTDGGQSWMEIGQDIFGGKKISEVVVAPADSSAVYAATEGGVYGSADKGVSWQDLSKGTGLRNAMALAFDPLDSSIIWAATAGGLYKTAIPKAAEATPAAVEVAEKAPAEEGAKAEEVVPEVTLPPEEEVETISLGEEEPFAAVEAAGAGAGGAGGAAPAGPPVPTIDDVQTILGQFAHEPTVQELQEVAMRFAEVHPDLIEGWRKGAKWRALLPDFKIKFEYERRKFSRADAGKKIERKTEVSNAVENEVEETSVTGVTIDQQTLFTEVSSYKITTDRDYRNERRRDRNIDFEFKWELGDFLYNPDQVRISDESRDLVELRNDVLEEVTQFYFQRRQLQVDLLLQPPEDLRERLRMELQLQEVTANIDYLTGGYLTQRLSDARQGKVRKSNIFKRLINI